jgi:hypothetical protein
MKDVFALNGGTFKFDPSRPMQFVALQETQVMLQTFPLNGLEPSQAPAALEYDGDTENREVFPGGSMVDREKGVMRTWNVLFRVKKYGTPGLI